MRERSAEWWWQCLPLFAVLCAVMPRSTGTRTQVEVFWFLDFNCVSERPGGCVDVNVWKMRAMRGMCARQYITV